MVQRIPLPPQVSAVLPGGVRLVGAHPTWPGTRPARPETRDTDLVQDRLELRGITPLPGRDHDGHGLLALFDSQVQLGGKATARAPEPVVVRLDGDAAGRLLLQLPLFLAPAACWWARHTVESTLMSQVISSFASAQACSAVKIRCQRPAATGGTGRTPGPTARTRLAGPARGCRCGPETVCRRSAAAWPTSAAVRASCPSATAVPAPPIAHPPDLHVSRTKIISRSRSTFDTRPSAVSSTVRPGEEPSQHSHADG